MANNDHLEKLKRGPEYWNLWRSKQQDLTRSLDILELYKLRDLADNLEPVDLSDADLSGLELLNRNLIGANLAGANLKGTDLRGCNLCHANLSRAFAYLCKFSSGQLRYADLSSAHLCYAVFEVADLKNANMHYADIRSTDFTSADLRGIDLSGKTFEDAILVGAALSGTSLKGANLDRVDARSANFDDADLSHASLFCCLLYNASLVNTNLQYARLINAVFVGTKIEGANFDHSQIYGASAWDLKGVPASQKNLIITRYGEPIITVDNLQVAQFIYLLLNNSELKNVIDTITSKAVLILGRFSKERKAVLDAIREELRKHNFTPILFDFDKPASKDVTGTVETLARMARFIIADLTDPSSIPHELATIVPHLRTTPVLPIRLKGHGGYSMFEDFQRDLPHRVFNIFEYEDCNSLIAALPEIIAPANERAEVLRSNFK